MNNISMIAAIGKRNELGLKNQLLCHLPADLKHFKEITSGHTVIMGDVTWHTLPVKPLPKRRNIVMTLDQNAEFEGCEVVHSVEEALKAIENEEKAFIMGGATIYKLFINIASKLYITRIQSEFEADVFFPEIDENRWQIAESSFREKDEKNIYDIEFQTLILK